MPSFTLTPAANDSLSQRNPALVGSDNPGSPVTHTVQHTFEIKASPPMGIGVPLRMIREWEVVTAATPGSPQQQRERVTVAAADGQRCQRRSKI